MLIYACLVLNVVANVTAQADFYISPQDSDEWSGTLAKPSDDKKDGPFATLKRVRELKVKEG